MQARKELDQSTSESEFVKDALKEGLNRKQRRTQAALLRRKIKKARKKEKAQ